jgi:hypothetical protein
MGPDVVLEQDSIGGRVGHRFGAHIAADGQLRLTTPAGVAIAIAPNSRGLALPVDEALETLQPKRRLGIDARTADCQWRGERMDYDHAGWLLMQAATREQSDGNQPAG